ncbi:CDP-glucose 4,6-dehydratase [Paenibacillus chartarius]|uniref:CDP-glucose 4,6-dehydratase n=1 Tax=Paenibacillus chartarius TaxID=747481 RepID=A0ABV6DMQ1_9BACL
MVAAINSSFWSGKRVLITGHTGFKGSWLTLWLHAMGAVVAGYSLPPNTKPSMFELCGLSALAANYYADVRNAAALQAAIAEFRPEVIVHMAAQPLVRASYEHPVNTYEVNVMGTVNLFEAIRLAVMNGVPVKAVLNVTTDKVYDNKEWAWGYREFEPLGGYDPYASSKACSELVTSSYRSSYFHPDRYEEHGVAVASARAGNVIGGGDWAKDRLIPDLIDAFHRGETITLRNPDAIRPWQHVMEPLRGYVMLLQKLLTDGPRFASAWNFGPDDDDAVSVRSVFELLGSHLGMDVRYDTPPGNQPHEHRFLKLDCSKSKTELNWKPIWSIRTAVEKIADWDKAYRTGMDMRTFTLRQIRQYMRDCND